MKKKYLVLTLIMLNTLFLNAENNASTEPPTPPETKKIKQQEFNNLTQLIAKYDGLSQRERDNRLKLEEAKRNFGIAKKNFAIVLDIKTLVENIHKHEDCYVAYYRLKDLDRRIASGSSDEIDISIYNEMKGPVQSFLHNCKELRIDLLEEYQK